MQFAYKICFYVCAVVMSYLIKIQYTLAVELGGQNIQDNSATNFNTMFGAMGYNSAKFPRVLVAFAYMLGLAFLIAAFFKFRDYVDDPSRAAFKDALVRFSAGAMLIALPFVAKIILNTLGVEDDSKIGYRGMLYCGTGNDC